MNANFLFSLILIIFKAIDYIRELNAKLQD